MIAHTATESATQTTDPDPGPRPDPTRNPQEIEIHETTYLKEHVAAFMRSREKYGDLSNMTFGFPLTVNEIVFQGPEGLYQALKFPDCPEFQQLIGVQKSGMDAKKTAYGKQSFRPDWEEVKVYAMRFVLAAKLLQHPRRFTEALAQTGTWPIVEMSFRDEFWAAKPKRSNTILAGVNMLGKLMTQLREELKFSPQDIENAVRVFTQTTPLEVLIINHRPVTITAATFRK